MAAWGQRTAGGRLQERASGWRHRRGGLCLWPGNMPHIPGSSSAGGGSVHVWRLPSARSEHAERAQSRAPATIDATARLGTAAPRATGAAASHRHPAQALHIHSQPAVQHSDTCAVLDAPRLPGSGGFEQPTSTCRRAPWPCRCGPAQLGVSLRIPDRPRDAGQPAPAAGGVQRARGRARLPLTASSRPTRYLLYTHIYSGYILYTSGASALICRS